jgi:membrane fusion protein (multidrug efflux system)
MIQFRVAEIAGVAVFAVLVFGLTACKGTTTQAQGQAPPMPVSVIEVRPHDVPIYGEYAAQTFGRDTVEVRGRVDGYLEKRTFDVGTDVKAGQVLYTLDAAPYQAEVQKAKADLAQSEAGLDFAKNQVSLVTAQANLQQAKANLLKAQQDVDRLSPLVSQDAATQQDLDNAQASLEAAKAIVAAQNANVDQMRLQTRTNTDLAAAQVEASRAVLKTAELNLSYTTIAAPVSGRIGDSLLQVGGLVTRSSPQPLTTIVPLDPIWVRFKISDTEYLDYMNSQERQNNHVLPVRLVLSDGSNYPYEGRIENNVNQLDTKTGTLEIDCTFPNPKHVILPGQFGRVRVLKQQARDAIVIPQRAVQETQSMQSVFTVGPDNKVQVRNIVTGDRVGDDWLVLEGLKPGDKVVVEGVQKIGPGSPVQATPYQPPPKTAAAQSKG